MMEIISLNKEWIFSGVGVFVLSSILGGLGVIARLIYLRFVRYREVINKYVGCYEVYKFKVRDDGTVAKSAAQVKWSWIGKLRVQVHSHKYWLQGTVEIFYQNVYFILQGARDVRGLWICHEPLNQFDYLLGVNCDISFAGIPTASKVLLVKVANTNLKSISTGDISANEVETWIIENLVFKSKRRINVNKPASPFIQPRNKE